MNNYLTPDSSAAFVDYPMMQPSKTFGYTKLCPVCKGHGGWNLLLNQYPLPSGKVDNSENRHLYAHFRAHCSHCNGWGYTHDSEMCTGHEWQHVANTGNCLNLYRCVKCGKEWEVDSSD